MDDDPSQFADMPSFTSLHNATELDIYVAPTAEKEKNVVRLALIPIACWRCNEQNFAFDSSFIDPGFTLGRLPELMKAMPDSLASMFGHADPVGDDDYNKILSGRRVKATYALLTRQHTLWHDLYEHQGGTADVWGERSTQAALSAVVDPAAPDGSPYYSGPVDGKVTPVYLDALHKFQSDNTVTKANTATHATREALYPAYMKKLCGDFEMKPEGFLGKGADPAGKMDYQGCSEFNPVVLLPKKEENTASDERNADNAPNRRVVMFLFRGNEDVKAADWPCPTAAEGTGKCRGQFWPGGVGDKRRKIGDERRDYAETGDTMACRFYDRFARRSPCEGRPIVIHPLNTIAITTDAPQFAPLTEKLVVSYTITGEMSQVWAVRFVVATKAEPDKALYDVLVDAPYSASGTYEWDGKVTDSSFDTCVSVKSSPYVLKMVLETKGGAKKFDSNHVAVAVVLKELDVRVEDPDGSTDAKLKPALDKLKSELASGNGTGRIVLDTPVFIARYNDLYDDSSYQHYKTELGDGLLVPLLGRVWLKGKDGTKKRSPHALKGIRVVWDVWLDDDSLYDTALAGRGLSPGAAPSANAFIKKVSAYKKDDTKPKGRTAHEYLGGLRSATPAYFTGISGWSEQAGAQRTWAALSDCADHDKVDADVGVKLKPGRLATDEYHVRAYVDIDATLDTTDDKTLDAVPAERRSAGLHITVWRRIEIQTVYKLGPNTPDMPVAPLTKEYKKAGMIVDPSASFMNADLTLTYKGLYQGALAAYRLAGDAFVALAAVNDPKEFPARFISYDDYKDKLKKLKPPPPTLFQPKNEADYGKKCDDTATGIIEFAVKGLAPFQPTGVTVFAWASNSLQDQDSHVGGFASVSPYGLYGGRNTAFFIFRTDDAGYAHELGHCLFLAHQPGAADKDHPPAGAVPDAHDETVHCLMSYESDARFLCGNCILKVEGWDTCGPDKTKPKIDRHGNVT